MTYSPGILCHYRRLPLLLALALLIPCLGLAQIPITGLVAYYPFNGNANDESGNGNHGTPVNGAALTADRFGKADSAYSFDGVNDYISIPTDASILNTPINQFSFQAWIRSVAGDGVTAQNVYEVHTQATSGEVYFEANMPAPMRFGIIDNSGVSHQLSSQSLELNAWYHVVGTYDGAKQRLYINGLPHDSLAWSGQMTLTGAAALGKDLEGGQQFNGLIDDIRIYSRDLSAAEIEALYHEGGWGVPPEIVSTSPAQNALNVALDDSISVTFDMDMDAASLDDTTFVVHASQTGKLPGTYSYDAGTYTATFTPDSPFKVGERVSVTLTTGVESAAGDTLVEPYTWGFTAEAPGGNGTFTTAENYGVGSYPYSVAAADLDGDGDCDLAVHNGDSHNVSVLLNNGNGTFEPAEDYGVGLGPTSVTAADLDGDGDCDLAVTNATSGNVSVLLNNGNGTFADDVTYGAGLTPWSVDATDLDGDGDSDLAVINFSSNTVSVLLNNGNGTFAAADDYGVGSTPRGVTASDLDGDGDKDLAVTIEGSGNVSILLNNGDGTFAAAVNYGAGSGPWSVTATDLDGDGDNDLAVANSGGSSLSVLLNNGTGAFATAVNYGVGSTPYSVTAADLDGDGDSDLAAANFLSDNVSVLLNNSSGAFSTAVNYGAGIRAFYVTAADLDGDGDNDLAVVNATSGNVSVLLNTGGLVAYYPFNGNANDESGNGNDGTVNGATLEEDRFGDVNSAYSFDGVDDVITGSLSQFAGGDAAITTAAWFYQPTASGHPGKGIVGVGATGIRQHFYQRLYAGPGDVAWNGGDDQNRLFIGVDNGNTDIWWGSNTVISTNEWHFAVTTYAPSSREVKIYVDGALDRTVTLSTGLSLATDLTIGCDGHNDNYFGGLIDDICIYDRALSAAEIDSLYHEGGWDAPAAVWHVSTSGDDGNDGSAVTPLRNIQTALNQAAAGDTVKVAGGTYAEALTTGVEVILRGGYDSGFSEGARDLIANKTTLRPASGNMFTDAYSSTLDGFVLDGSSLGSGTRAVYVTGGFSTITHNVITNIHTSGSYGIYVASSAGADIRNNTIYGNILSGGGVIFYAVSLRSGADPATLVQNNIIVNNNVGLTNYLGADVADYNNVYGSTTYEYDGTYTTPGANDVNASPKLVNPGGGDFRLKGGSPCIDAGNPADDAAAEPEPNGGRINMGAYGGTPQAMPSINPVTYVSTGGSDTNDGSIGAPYRSIQYAFLNAMGDTIKVAGGTYQEGLISQSPVVLLGGYDDTFLEAGRRVYENRTTVLAISTTIFTDNHGCTVDGFVFEGNASCELGVRATNGTVLTHNVIWRVGALGGTGLETTGGATVVNNTIVDDGAGIDIYSGTGTPVIKNNIIAYNSFGVNTIGYDATVRTYNNVYGNTFNYIGFDDNPGLWDISADPEFVDWNNGDFFLQETSPCIERGDPDAQYNDPDGSRNDMGAYYYTPPTPPTILSTIPAKNALNVPLDDSISVTFDMAMDVASLDNTTFIVHGSQTGRLPGMYSYDAGTYTATFSRPASLFKVGEQVNVTLTTDIQSAAGDTLASPHAWSFTIEVLGGSGEFAAQATYAAGSLPWSITSADLDGDGDIDLAIANENSNNISVLLGNGDGTFADQVPYATADAPYGITATDLDGDGNMDLATANYYDNISILLGNGNGTFTAQTPYPAGDGPRSITAADLDGDGDADLAVANELSGNVSILLGNDDGTFADQTTYATGGNPWSVTAADLDGDGDADLVAANEATDNISVLLGAGDGTFADETTHDTGDSPRSVAVADLNGDGDLDLAITNEYSNDVSVLLGNGNGSFADQIPYGAGNYPGFVVAADLDGDGNADLATANNYSDDVSVLLGNGDGTFAAQTTYSTADYPASVTAADIDGDGDLDLATANYHSGDVSVLLNTGGAPSVAGLVAYYPFNGNANDESGNGNDGTVNEAMSADDRFGDASSAYSFDGVDDYIATNTNFDVGTLSFWFKTDLKDAYNYILGQQFDSNVEQGNYTIYVTPEGDLYLNFTLQGGIGSDVATVINDNTWHHAVFLSGEEGVTFYVDNVPVGGDAEKTNVLGAGDNDDDLMIGRAGVDDIWHYFDGSIDDIRIYNRALSEAEIQTLHEEGGWPPPAAPTNLTATPGDRQVTLAWDANSEADLAKYRIYRDTVSPTITLIDSVVGTPPDTFYTDTGLTNGQEYFFRITAVDDAGNESGYSTEVHAMPTAYFPGEYTADANTVLLLHLDETSDTTVYDASGYGSHGQATGTTIVDGKFGKAREFEVDGEGIDIAHNDALDLGSSSFTVEFWIQITNPNMWHDHPVEKGTGGTPYFCIQLLPTPHLSISDGSELPGHQVEVFSSAPITDGRWHHMAGMRDGGTIKVFVDGILEGTADASLVGSVDNTAGLSMRAGPAVLDEVRVSNVARTPEELLGHYELAMPPAAPTSLVATPGGGQITLNWSANSEGDLAKYRIYRDTSSPASTLIDSVVGSPPDTFYTDIDLTNGQTYYYRITAVDDAGNESAHSTEVHAMPTAYFPGEYVTDANTVLLLHLNETSGTTVYDASGYGNHGNFSDGMLVQGIFGNAYQPTSSNGISVPTFSSADLGLADQFTIECWVNLTEAPLSNYDFIGFPGFRLFIGTDLSIAFAVTQADGENAGNATDLPAITLGDWHHMAGTYNKYAGLMILYLDGVAQFADHITQSIQTTGSGGSIGALDQGFPGIIDEVRISNVALSTEEIWAHYELAIPPAAPTGLAAIGEYNQVRLVWSPNEEADLAHYVVYQSLVPGFTPSSTDSVAVALPPDTSIVIPNLSAGPTYYFQIAARDLIDNLSPPSSEVMATTPGTPDETTNIQVVTGDGEVAFPGTDMTMNFTSQSGTDTIQVTANNASPGGTLPSDATLAAERYWIIIHTGGEAFTADMTLNLGPDAFTAGDQQYPVRLFLLQRDSGGTLPWEIETSGASATDSTVTFTGLTGFSQFAVGRTTDTEGPSITNIITSTSPQKWDDITVTATVTDPKGLRAVDLHYAQGGASGFTQMPMSFQGNDTELGTIPGSIVAENGVAYFISAEDGLGNVSQTDTMSIQVGFPSETLSTSMTGSAFPDGFPKNKWRLISIPGDIADTSVSSIIEAVLESARSDKTWKIFRYTGPDPDDYVAAIRFTSGESYFLKQIVAEDVHFILGDGQSADLTSGSLTLAPGEWHFVSSPYAFPVEVTANQSIFSGPYTYGEFGPGGQESWSMETVQYTLQPWGGYIVHNNAAQPQTLEIKPPGLAKARLAKHVENELPAGWLLHLTAVGAHYFDGGNVIGRIQGATEGLDNYDHPEPPYIEGYVSLTMERPDWDGAPRTADVRSIEKSDGVWDLVLRTMGEKVPINLTFKLEGDLPAAIALLDVPARELFDLKNDPRPVAIAGYHEGFPHRLKVMAGSAKYVANSIQETLAALPEDFAIHQNYPNPFNPSTTIEYALPKPGRVSLSVYNLIGQEIAILLNDWQDIGYHEIVWHGRDRIGRSVASGVYFVVLRADHRILTQKMVLLK